MEEVGGMGGGGWRRSAVGQPFFCFFVTRSPERGLKSTLSRKIKSKIRKYTIRCFSSYSNQNLLSQSSGQLKYKSCHSSG